MQNQNKHFKKYSNLYLILLIALFFLFWQLAVNQGWINTFNFSSPSALLNELIDLFFVSGDIYQHLFFTLGVSAVGLVSGSILGLIFAFVFANIESLHDIFSPIFVMFNSVPKLALGPVFIVWFGIGTTSKVIMSATEVFFRVFFNGIEGFRNVDQELIDTMKMFGANNFQIFAKVILPSMIPWLVPVIRTGASTAVIGAIVGEYLGSSRGIGWMIQNAGGVYNMTRVITCILVLMVTMYIIDMIFRYFEKRILIWQ